jgi:hypothetical protein
MLATIQAPAENGEHLIQCWKTNRKRRDATSMGKFNETQQKK